MKKAVLTILFAASALLLGQDSKLDPEGWTKAKWGITQAEVKKIFPEAVELTNEIGRRYLALTGFTIETTKFTVGFAFDKEDRLTGVALKPEDRGPANAVAKFAQIFLLEKLTDKYGKPTQASEDSNEYGTTRKWEWLFPKTKITLMWTAHRRDDYKDLDRTVCLYNQWQETNGI